MQSYTCSYLLMPMPAQARVAYRYVDTLVLVLEQDPSRKMQNKLPSRRAGGVKRFVQDCFEKSRKCKTNILYFSISSHVETWGDQDEFAWQGLAGSKHGPSRPSGQVVASAGRCDRKPGGRRSRGTDVQDWASDPNDLKLRA